MTRLHIPAFIFLAACVHSQASPQAEGPVAEKSEKQQLKDHFKDGWQSIKEGGKQLAAGAAVGAKQAGKAIQSAACPVAVNISTGVYYAEDTPGYDSMLSAEQYEVRECFISEANARAKGYRIAK
jgi:hypothetical protein